MTETSRRLFLAAGSAGAAFGALSAVARPSDLDSLIEAHRRALVAFEDAFGAEQAAQAAFDAKHPKGITVPSGFGGCYSVDITSRDEAKAIIAEDFERARVHLTNIERIAPGSTAFALTALAAKEADVIAAVDAILDKEAGDLKAAEKKRREASEAEDAAVLAVCAYPCTTIEEARRKAAYVAAIPSIEDFGDGHVLAFIRSFRMSAEASP